ncbi:unnamed protein product [Miscanthus lutarioriparius]|uniref:C3H1-type domain-containing protein n=1 Tax=Miscanthus lutarioriparius TaxID=422564 RepID=A0A811NSX5_9POAL|nr:unnamed protein product [Miscanthus lutarioriparius]CAD6233183.1 unnamed protein product [Miscanthus lutarioriparius]
MMMMGEGLSEPPWSHHVPVSGVDVGGVGDEMTPYLLAALRQYLPCNDAAGAEAEDEEAADAAAMAAGVDGYGCDEFRMYEFKVRRCARARSHDWTECPFAHPGEKARRRDPRKYHYSGTACPDFRKGGCKRGDNCDLAHGVFECWLHPARYRTQPCKDGTGCRRRVCFFAHTPDQLRVLPTTQHQQSSPRGAACSPLAESYDGSPLRRQAFESYLTTKSIVSSSPTSSLMSSPKSPPSESPPLSPDGAAAFRRGSWPGVGSPVNDVLATLRQLRLSKANSSPSSGWGGYPACAVAYGSHTAGGPYSLPSTPRATPTTLATASGYMANLEPLDVSFGGDEEPVERVESGRALRAKVFERLSREGVVSGDATAGIGGPDVGWVSDLIN